MTKSFQLISILLICLGFISCSKNTYPIKTGSPAIVPISSEVQKYNLKMDFMSKHFNGILVIRKMNDGEIRILASTLFGLSLFDFGLKGENWQVYSCIEPMRKDRILKIFEKDFKLLFLPDRNIIKKEDKEDKIKFVAGSGLSKSVIYITHDKESIPEKIRVKHSWLRLNIELDKIIENNVTE